MTDINAKIQEASAKNSELLRILAETDHATPDLEEQQRYIHELKTQLSRSEQTLKKLETKRELELKDHEKYRDSTVKRFMYKAAGKKDRFAEKAEKEEREYFEVLQQSHQEKQLNGNLREQLDEAERARGDLEVSARRHKDAQNELDSLYNSIFAGPTPQFPGEDEKERASDECLQAYHNTRIAAESEGHALKLLSDAIPMVRSAMASMDSARSHSRVDMFGGGAVWDMLERSELSKAEMAMQQARGRIEQAKQVAPQVGSFPGANINHGHIFRDVFFDNIFTDMQFHEEIKRGQSEIMRYYNVLDQETNKAKQRYQALERELRQREAALEQARIALQRERGKAFERYAGGQSVEDVAPPPGPPPTDSSGPKKGTNPFGDPPPQEKNPEDFQ